MRRYRLLIYDGPADWIAPHRREFIKPNEPYRCGKGSIHSMELIPSGKLNKSDGFRDAMRMLESFADEVVDHETREVEDGN